MTNRKIIAIGVAIIICFIALGIWFCMLLINPNEEAETMSSITPASEVAITSSAPVSTSSKASLVSSADSKKESTSSLADAKSVLTEEEIAELSQKMTFKPRFIKQPLTDIPAFLNIQWGMSVDEALSILGYNRSNVKYNEMDLADPVTNQTVFIEGMSLYGTATDVLLSFGDDANPLYQGLQKIYFSTTDESVSKIIIAEIEKVLPEKGKDTLGAPIWRAEPKTSDYYDAATWRNFVDNMAHYSGVANRDTKQKFFDMQCVAVSGQPIVQAELKTTRAKGEKPDYRFTIDGSNACSFAAAKK